MLLKVLYWLKLTYLTRQEVEAYETVTERETENRSNWKLRAWGLLSLALYLILVVAGVETVSMLKTLVTISDLQAKVSTLASSAAAGITRGGDEEGNNPYATLRRVRARVRQIYQELSTLRSQGIDYSSLPARRERLAALNRELGQLSAETALARKKIGAEP